MCLVGTGHAGLAAQLMGMSPEEADKEVRMPPHLLMPCLKQTWLYLCPCSTLGLTLAMSGRLCAWGPAMPQHACHSERPSLCRTLEVHDM